MSKTKTQPCYDLSLILKKKRKNTHDAEADVEIKRSGAERLAGAGGTPSRWDLKENDDGDDGD